MEEEGELDKQNIEKEIIETKGTGVGIGGLVYVEMWKPREREYRYWRKETGRGEHWLNCEECKE